MAMFIFRFNLYHLLLLIYSTTSIAGDPVIEKQRQFQQQRFDRFNGLSRNFGFKNETKTAASPPVQQPPAFADNIAFPKGVRDPFAIPSILLQSLANERSKKERKLSASPYAFSNTALLSVPKITLKGVMNHNNSASPLAIILLGSETFMVREGDEIGFNSAEPSQVIKIKEIKRLSVLVEIGSLGALVIVR